MRYDRDNVDTLQETCVPPLTRAPQVRAALFVLLPWAVRDTPENSLYHGADPELVRRGDCPCDDP